MSDINWEDLSKDLVEILEKNKFLELTYNVKEFTWATGDSRYEVCYKVATEDNSWELSEDYILDKDDEDDVYNIVDSKLKFLKKNLSKKGYSSNIDKRILRINKF